MNGEPMNRARPIIAALFVGWVSGVGSWYVITKAPDAAGERGQHDALSAGPDSPAGEAGEERLAVFPPPAVAGNPRDVSVRAVLPPAVDDMPADMPMLPVAAGNPADADDGIVQDTGEFIDVDDPQAYAAYWDRQSDGVVHDTGEFVAVDAWQALVDSREGSLQRDAPCFLQGCAAFHDSPASFPVSGAPPLQRLLW